MKTKLNLKMRKLILDMFKSIPGLQENYCLPPRWYLNDKIIKLNTIEKEALDNAIDELEDEGILTVSQNSMGVTIAITAKGIEYITLNKLEEEEMNSTNNNHINIDTVNAENLQVGNDNQMYVNITPNEFIELIEKITTKPKEEQKTIFKKLADFAKNGLSTINLINKLKDLL